MPENNPNWKWTLKQAAEAPAQQVNPVNSVVPNVPQINQPNQPNQTNPKQQQMIDYINRHRNATNIPLEPGTEDFTPQNPDFVSQVYKTLGSRMGEQFLRIPRGNALAPGEVAQSEVPQNADIGGQWDENALNEAGQNLVIAFMNEPKNRQFITTPDPILLQMAARASAKRPILSKGGVKDFIGAGIERAFTGHNKQGLINWLGFFLKDEANRELLPQTIREELGDDLQSLYVGEIEQWVITHPSEVAEQLKKLITEDNANLKEYVRRSIINAAAAQESKEQYTRKKERSLDVGVGENQEGSLHDMMPGKDLRPDQTVVEGNPEQKKAQLKTKSNELVHELQYLTKTTSTLFNKISEHWKAIKGQDAPAAATASRRGAGIELKMGVAIAKLQQLLNLGIDNGTITNIDENSVKNLGTIVKPTEWFNPAQQREIPAYRKLRSLDTMQGEDPSTIAAIRNNINGSLKTWFAEGAKFMVKLKSRGLVSDLAMFYFLNILGIHHQYQREGQNPQILDYLLNGAKLQGSRDSGANANINYQHTEDDRNQAIQDVNQRYDRDWDNKLGPIEPRGPMAALIREFIKTANTISRLNSMKNRLIELSRDENTIASIKTIDQLIKKADLDFDKKADLLHPSDFDLDGFMETM